MHISERYRLLQAQNHQAFPIDNPARIWKRSNIRLDVTVVIPICVPTILAQHAYPQAKKVLLLSNNNGPTSIQEPPENLNILRLPWTGHAHTRKQALAYIDTKYTFFSVQDAYPIGDMLLHLIQEMETTQWDILLPRQLPWPDADSITKQRISRWMPAADNVYPFPQADHVGALYRSDDLRAWPLADAPIAEDVWWSIGRRIGCMPQAQIFHSHQRNPRSLFDRERAIHFQLHQLGKLERPQWRQLLSIMRQNQNRRTNLAEFVGQVWGWWESRSL